MATITAYVRCTRAVDVPSALFETAVTSFLGPFAAPFVGAKIWGRQLRVPVPDGQVIATLAKLRGVYRAPLPPEISSVDLIATGCTVAVFESGDVGICNP